CLPCGALAPGERSGSRRTSRRGSRGVRPSYLQPSMSRVLASTYGQLVYVDQLVAIIKLLGFEHGWAERFRRTIGSGRRAAERNDMERLVRGAGGKRGWMEEQINGRSSGNSGGWSTARSGLSKCS